MLILKIIDSNSNSFYLQKIKDFNFQKIHYGGYNQLSCILEENPFFQNHKVKLFNNIHLYYYSKLVWQGYITEFQKDFINLNYNLKASGLLTDLMNKRIKKTYVLDDIGDFRNWNEKNNKQSDEILYGYSQATDEKGIKISLLQRNYVAGEDGLFELKIDENIERLKARVLISQPANFTTKLVTLDENHSNPNEEKKWENAQKIDEDVILDITRVASGASGTFTKKIYPSDDAEVYNREGGTNFGSSSQIRLKEYVYLHRGFIRFATTEIPVGATILSATLKVYKFWNYNAPNADGYRVANSWSEGTITYNNQPGITGSKICTYSGVLPTGWKSMNVLSTFKNWWNGTWANYGLRFKVNSASGILDRFYSKEASSAYRPYIEVKYSVSGEDVEVNKRYIQFRIECTGSANITTDKYFAQLENLKLLTSDSEINAANILKDLLFNHTQKLELDASLIQDCFNYKDIELCESLDGWSVSEGLTIYNYNFTIDDGNWTLSNATISGGILQITSGWGYGRRSPDADWYSGATNDFEMEFDFRMDSDVTEGAEIFIKLVGDDVSISFDVKGAQYDVMRILYSGSRAEQSFVYVINTWYTGKIRRVGTIYYFSINSGTELSWDYGTEREVEYITLSIDTTTGDYDNFKYSWIIAPITLENTIVKEGSHSIKCVIPSNNVNEHLFKTLSPAQNLQNKNLFRLWVRSTITGDILKARFGENSRYQYEPDWSCQYEADQEPPSADSVWTLTGTDYGSVADGILTINKVATNECYYKREDVGHNVKGNTIITKVKVSNSAKTTLLGIEDGIAKIYLAIYTNKIEDWNDAANVYTVDMTKYRELWFTMKNNFWILYVDGVFALCGETQTTTTKGFYFGMDSSGNLGKSYWDYVYYYNLGFLRNKRIEKTITIDVADTWEEKIIDLNNFPIATRDAIKYIQFEVLTNSAFTFYIDQIRSNFELTSAYYRDRTAPLNILEDVLAYQDYEWTITKDKKVEFFEVDRDEIDYICPIRNLVFEENSTSYFSKIYLVYFDEMMKRQEIELTDENSEIPFDKEHVIGLGGISDVGAKAIGEAQFDFHKKPRYQLSCVVDNFVFDKNGGIIKSVEIEPNKNIKFLGIPDLPIFRIIKTSYANEVCTLTLETEEETITNITKSIIEVL